MKETLNNIFPLTALSLILYANLLWLTFCWHLFFTGIGFGVCSVKSKIIKYKPSTYQICLYETDNQTYNQLQTFIGNMGYICTIQNDLSCKFGIYLAAKWILSIYASSIIGLFYLPLSVLLYWEKTQHCHKSWAYLSLSLVLDVYSFKTMHMKWFCTSVFQRWRPCSLNSLCLTAQEIQGAFVPLLSRSAEGLNEIDNNKVLSTCKWQT